MSQLARAISLVEQLTGAGINARLFGGTAIAIRAASVYPIRSVDLKDIDIVVHSSGVVPALRLLTASGWNVNRRALMFGARRVQCFQSSTKLELFVDPLVFNQRIEIGERLTIDPLTLTLADLLLTKLQIHRFSSNDLADISALLRLAQFSDGDCAGDYLNISRLSDCCARSWCLWYAALRTLDAVERSSPQPDSYISERVSQLRGFLSAVPKSLTWRFRSLIGPRLKWYYHVDV